jgi:flagellar hook-basal body complex protein FliE
MIAPLSLASLPVPVSPDVGGNVAETTGAGGASFPNLLTRLLGSEAQGHANATAAVRDMAMGKADNLHEVMLQMAQADLSFHLILEIRNRLTDAYQEIMKMQV